MLLKISYSYLTWALFFFSLSTFHLSALNDGQSDSLLNVQVYSNYLDWEERLLGYQDGYEVTSVTVIDEGLSSGTHKMNLDVQAGNIRFTAYREIYISDLNQDANQDGIIDLLDLGLRFNKTFNGYEDHSYYEIISNNHLGDVRINTQYKIEREVGSNEFKVYRIGNVSESTVYGILPQESIEEEITYISLSTSYGSILVDDLNNHYAIELNSSSPEGIFTVQNTGNLTTHSVDQVTMSNFPLILKPNVSSTGQLSLQRSGENYTGQIKVGEHTYVIKIEDSSDSDQDEIPNLSDRSAKNQIIVRTEPESLSYLAAEYFLYIDNENTLWRVWDSNKTKIVSNVDSVKNSIPLTEIITLKDGSSWQFIDSLNLYEIKDPRDLNLGYDWGYYLLFQPSGDDLWGIGNNWGGQLGIGKKWLEETGYYYEPEPIQIVDSGVVSAGAGWNYSLFTKNDGSLWGMGSNPLFSFMSDQNESLYPVKIPGIDNISSVKLNSIALLTKNDQSLWGLGVYEPILTGHTEFADPEKNRIRHTTPYLLSSEPVTHSQIGGGVTTFVKSNGSLWGIGYNDFAQLGKDSPSYVSDPIEILPNGVYSSHQYGGNLAVVKTNGELWDFGFRNWIDQNQSNHLIPNSRRVTFKEEIQSEYSEFKIYSSINGSVSLLETEIHLSGQKLSIQAPAILDYNFTHWLGTSEYENYEDIHKYFYWDNIWSKDSNLSLIPSSDLLLFAFYEELDEDLDGLTNAKERELGTNPQSDDSDSDGLSDYDEIHSYGTNPSLSDSDGDGLTDFTEVSTGYDPLIENDKERIQKLITLLKNENLNFVFPEGWFFTESKGWQWTRAQVYPWVYSNNEKGWLYFSVKSKKPFYSYKSKSWTNY